MIHAEVAQLIHGRFMSPTVLLMELCSSVGFSEFQTKFRIKKFPIISILYVLYDQLYVVVMIEN